MPENNIPPITDPMGKHWKQPPTGSIGVTDTQAHMSRATFDQLAEYSASNPTGVYDGKMWRRHDGAFDRKCPPENRKWLLCWYGPATEPKMCTIHQREIVLFG